CDDAVATTYTGATEVWYDGVDGDCGGDSDYDADGDGFDGDTWGGTDCDDAVATTYTGAAEMVNSTDDDCNGLIDDGTSAYDDDGDGYSEDAGDCDDDERLAVPGGTEICGDGIDNDCVDGDDSCSLSGSYAIADFGDERYGPNAWDFFGLAISVADFDGDGTEELTSASGFEPAYGHVWSEAPTGSAAADTDSWLVSYPSPYFNCNAYYAGPISPGDVNNDGYADLLGACASDTRSTGITYLVHGPITGPIDMGALAVATTVGEDWSSTAHLNEFGDLNNDGYDDLAIGAHLWNSSSYHGVGKMYIVYGPHSTNLDFSVDSADIELYPDDRDYQWMGDGAARAADFTGDGIPDLLQGHPWDDHNGTYSGSIAFFEGPVGSGSHVIYDADLDFIYGESAYDQLGGRLTVLNDIDGDGTPDLAVAAPGEALTMYGKVHVITDPPPYGQNIQDVASATVTGDWMAGSFGSAIEAADVDFDGQDDIVVGASNYGSGEEGAVYLFHGPLTGTLSASSADVFIEGTTADAGLGVELSRPSDLDGDGLLDLAIGAAYDDTHGASSGKMYLVYGL
ncbi:MAG: hypothetical protein CL927_02505, partial [Deltaproteobacteria bacterium]|nr:hypothetical protein [Deltaproteobacteria bacterium]